MENRENAMVSTEDESIGLQTRNWLATLGAQLVPRTSSDDTLLVEAMLLVASADGKLDREERVLFETYSQVIRDFRGSDFGALLCRAQANIEAAGTWQAAVRRLPHLSSRELRRKCFVLAVDFAFVSGDVSTSEIEVVSAMAEALELPADFVRNAIEIAACRHGGPKSLPAGS